MWNPTYYDYQKKIAESGETESESDEWGNIDIPSDTSFFFMLTDLGLFAVKDRRNDLAQTVTSIPIAMIKPIFKSMKGYSGGIEDLGNFKEGFCFGIFDE